MKAFVLAAVTAVLLMIGIAAPAEGYAPDEARARSAVLLYLETEIPEDVKGEISFRPALGCRTVTFKTAADEIVMVDLDDRDIRRVVRSHTGEKDFVTWELDKWFEEWGCAWASEDKARVAAMEPQMSAYLDAHGVAYQPWTHFADVGATVTTDDEETTDIYLRFYYLAPGSGDLLGWRGSVRVLYSLYQREICGVDLLPDSIG